MLLSNLPFMQHVEYLEFIEYIFMILNSLIHVYIYDIMYI